ncbi:glutamate receptor-interacting protein 2-like isoform X3 [Portunus trituberculatus]|uniref:glutamate receptor-interacting protein 2-like isoform X3 n=1 Tax=Portunus trituberculatus TaxID=210409 RepID=UPI001E1CDC7B|nr:glutamate receptor-interacting protein 2-like isoform X3 [Portunus trituberculatus]
MASFLQFALSPFPRRRSRRGSSASSQDTASSTPPTPTPTRVSPPKTRSVGIQTPVLERRAGHGLRDAPSTPGSLRRLKGAWGASPLLSRRSSRDTLREDSLTPTPASSPPPLPEMRLSTASSRRLTSPPATSSCASLSSHEPPPTPPSSCNSSFHFDGPSTSTPTPTRRRRPSDSSLDSEGAHVVHVGAAGLEMGGMHGRGWQREEREVVLRGVGGSGRRAVVRESVRMSQCVVWECLSLPILGRRKTQRKGEEVVAPEYLASNREQRTSFISEEVRGVSTVQLIKKEGCTLGIIVAGGVDKGHRARVANLRPGSPAHRSDALSVGDYILAVNGVRTQALSHAQVVSLLKNAGEKVDLEVEYEIPNSPVQGSGCVVARTVGVLLEKEENSFGFTVRGGTSLDPSKTRPLIITHVRPGGPADREGTIKAGDRLVAVDGRDLSHCSLKDAQEMLQRIERAATLTIEYDVSVMESVRASGGPLLVEIERAAGTSLGISLTSAHPEPSTIIIETIRPASIAERCGALAVNDVVAAIDGTRLDQLTVAEAAQLLKTAPGSHVTLEIIPGPAAQSKIPFCRGGGVAFPHLYGVVGSSSGYNSSGGGGGGGYLSPGSSYNTLTSQRTRSSAARRVNRRPRPGDRSDTASLSSHTTGGSVGGAGVGVCHSECLTVTLVVEGRGYGLVLRPPPHATDPDTALPFVAAMDPGGPADKCSVICVGDRIMGVNGRSVSGLGVSEVTQMVANSRPTVTLDVEFDVADSVVPSSGTFAVKLAKRHNGLGITLTVSRRAGAGEPLLISEVVRGSPAHRSGTMQPGDRLLAIDSTRLEHLTLEDAKSILHCCDDIVTLRVQKDELYSAEESGSLVMYTVELVRHGGALGITISGSEEPFDPIYIAGLAPGGLADRTGAIHVGDRLLAINGVSLRGKPLSEAILMLQNSGDTVTLKISRPRDSGVTSDDLGRNDWLGRFGPAIPSVDSAVESWDSSGLDPVPPGSTPALSKRDSGSDIVFRSDCGSTVRRRAGNEGREELAGSGDTDNSEANKRSMEGDMDEARRSPSPPPSIDSGQSEDKTDWDKMIADLNQISESCGLRELPHTSHTHLSHTRTVSPQLHKEVHVSGLEGLSSTKTIGDTALCPTLASRRRAGDRSDVKEEGSYSVSHATLTYSRTTSPPRHVTFPAADGGQVYQVTLHKDCIYEDFGFSVSDGLYEKGVYVNRIRKAGPADRSGVLKPYDRILQVNDTRTHDFDCCLTVPLMAAAGDRLVLVVSRNPHAHPTLDFSSDVLSPTWNSIEESKEEEEEEEEHDLAQEHGSPLYSPLTPSLTPIPTVLKTL